MNNITALCSYIQHETVVGHVCEQIKVDPWTMRV